MNGERAFFDQQPIEASAMVSACISAYHLTSTPHWMKEAVNAFDWFMGKNVAAMPLYCPSSGGCYDGLHIDRVNLNQGAESTISFLSALIELKNTYSSIHFLLNPHTNLTSLTKELMVDVHA